MVRGEVHDENAWSLGGVAGHAGLFSTAHDLAVLAQTLLNGGRYGHARILEADTVRAMLINENTEFPGDSHGLGFELDQRWYMDGLSDPGHGRAHRLHRHLGGDRPAVRLVRDPADQPGAPDAATGAATTRPGARSRATSPGRSRCARSRAATAWFSGIGDARTVTLTAPATAGRRS